MDAILRKRSLCGVLALALSSLAVNSLARGRREDGGAVPRQANVPTAPTALIAPDQIANRCSPDLEPSSTRAAWAGWSPDPANRRYQPASQAGFAGSDVPRLKLKWAFGLPNVRLVRSQPAVFNGRVYLGGNDGTLYSVDAATGCTFWAATASKSVRSGIALGKAGLVDAVFFGDAGGDVYALDASTGRLIWGVPADPHPAATITGTPTYYDERLYVPVSSGEEQSRRRPDYSCCTFRGSVVALDASSGKTIWKTYMAPETPSPQGRAADGHTVFGPSGMAIWSSPTLDLARKRVYVGTGDNYAEPDTPTADSAVALDLGTGALLWSVQFTKDKIYKIECGDLAAAGCSPPTVPEFDLGASPVLVSLSSKRRVLILGQKSGMIYGVDPDANGKLLWHDRAGAGGLLGGVQWGMASDGRAVYVAVSDLAFQGRGPDPTKGGGISAYQVSDGKLLWKTPPPGCGDRRPCSPAQSQAVTVIPGAVFSGSIDGHLRAYDTRDGKIIWDFDTARSFDTTNGVSAKGGSLDVGGPVVAGGMMFVMSGYPGFGAMPGNVLLAFSPQ